MRSVLALPTPIKRARPRPPTLPTCHSDPAGAGEESASRSLPKQIPRRSPRQPPRNDRIGYGGIGMTSLTPPSAACQIPVPDRHTHFGLPPPSSLITTL